MKYIVFSMLLLIAIFAANDCFAQSNLIMPSTTKIEPTTQNSETNAQEPTGFLIFKFGDTWDGIRKQAIKDLNLKPKSYGPYVKSDAFSHPTNGSTYNFLTLDPLGKKEEKTLVISNHIIGKDACEVKFFFDPDGVFYRYEMWQVPSWRISDYDVLTPSVTRRWIDIFTAKYGEVSGGIELPNPFQLTHRLNLYKFWKFEKHTAAVMIFHDGAYYNVTALVQDDLIAAKYKERLERSESIDAKKAANDF